MRTNLRKVVVASICSVLVPNKLYSLCSNDNENNESLETIKNNTSPCSKYNLLSERLDWQGRRRRCNNDMNGCVLIGRSFTGNCISVASDDDIEKAMTRIETENVNSKLKEATINDKNTNRTELSTDVAIGDAISITVNEIASTNVKDTLKMSEENARIMAKNLIAQVLVKEENQHVLGEALKYLFTYEEVLYPTRWLIYWSLQQENTIFQSEFQLRWQLNYWLNWPEPYGAFNYTVNNLADLAAWWLHHPLSRKDIINPFIRWYLDESEGIISQQIAKNLSDYSTKKIMVQTIKAGAVQVLKSEEVKNTAKQALYNYLQTVNRKGTEAPPS